jgi:hypothetical protein
MHHDASGDALPTTFIKAMGGHQGLVLQKNH